MSSKPRRTAALVAAVTVLTATATATAGAAPAGALPTPPTSIKPKPRPQASEAQAKAMGFRFFDIKAKDGVVLKGNVIEPKTPGKHPAIVFTNSWGVNQFEYLAQAAKMAQRGYVALSYTTRGLYESGGQATIAGPKEVADISTVIDYLIAHTSADRNRIGHAGISYGAGLGLLAAGHDRRIKAVAALSAWSDLVYSLYTNETRLLQSPGALYLVGKVIGRPAPEVDAKLADFYANRNIPAMLKWAKVRSGASYVNAINRNHPAILMGNAYGDSIFPPNQLVDLFGKLTGPKRLELAPGDHATVEGAGLAGLPNRTWENVTRWFDQYLALKTAGKDTGVTREGTVVLTPHGSSRPESYASWSAVAKRTERYDLGSGWNRMIHVGTDTPASSGTSFVSSIVDQFGGPPPQVWLPSVNRRDAAVWQSAPLTSARRVRGVPKLRLTVTPSARRGSLFGYLYDVDAGGNSKLITHIPFSYLSAKPGATLPVTLAFEATAYDVPTGHRIAVVVDTKDSRYIDADESGSTVTFSSPDKSPSALELPTR